MADTVLPGIEEVRYRSTLRFLAEGVEGLILFVAIFFSWPVSRHWLANWRSTDDERSSGWPGDELVSDPDTVYTRAIEIAATPSDIWPWIVQFGFGRAGFYSYEILERLVGIPVKNVESIVPAMQSLRVGDKILLHPTAPGIPVADCAPNVRLCFGVSEEIEADLEKPDPARSWSMYLQPNGPDSTRLILRGCIEPLRNPGIIKNIGHAVVEPIDFLMEQRMLRTLRRLVETRGGGETSRHAQGLSAR